MQFWFIIFAIKENNFFAFSLVNSVKSEAYVVISWQKMVGPH